MRSAPGIAFDYRPSHRVALAATALSLAAIAAPWFSALSFAACVALSLAALGIAVHALRRFVRDGVCRIAYGSAGWRLIDADTTESAAELIAHAGLGPWLALDFRAAGRRRFRAILGPGNADAETRRRLILLLSRAEVAQAP